MNRNETAFLIMKIEAKQVFTVKTMATGKYLIKNHYF